MQEYKKFFGEGKPPLDYILRTKYYPDYSYKGVFLDIGAGEPIYASSSYHFEKNGWEVYCAEANPIYIERLKEKRQNIIECAVCDKDIDNIEFNVVSTKIGEHNWQLSCSSIHLREDYLQYVEDLGGSVYDVTKVNTCAKTLKTICDEYNIKNIDILLVDVEGGELDVLNGINEDILPDIIVYEDILKENTCVEWMNKYNYELVEDLGHNKVYKKCN